MKFIKYIQMRHKERIIFAFQNHLSCVILICSLLIIFVNVQAQDSLFIKTSPAVVANDKMNIFYLGIDNPLSVSSICQKRCQIKTDNGHIVETSGYYYIVPSVVGKCTITLSDVNKKKIQSFEFRVVPIPKPTITIALKARSGEIDQYLLCNGVLILEIPNLDIDIFFPVRYFDMLITTGEGKIYSFSNTSQQFTDEMKEQLCKLKSKDVVMIYNVRANIGSDKQNEVYPDPAVYIVR